MRTRGAWGGNAAAHGCTPDSGLPRQSSARPLRMRVHHAGNAILLPSVACVELRRSAPVRSRPAPRPACKAEPASSKEHARLTPDQGRKPHFYQAAGCPADAVGVSVYLVSREAATGGYRCVAVPGDGSSKVGRLPSPNADFCPASGRRLARKWQRHRPVWGGLLTLRNWAGKARGRSAPV